MARVCDNCKKGIMYGNNVSHAKNRTKRIFAPNLHVARIMVMGIKKKMRLCTKCVRMLKRKLAPKVSKIVSPQVTATV
ncbi:MAG: 50S ribosomal protein L28 [Candidatus Levybacteria bacterium]|nr:50S ribosomal protein L28 [Candidatus Levybacteria bacterium]